MRPLRVLTIGLFAALVSTAVAAWSPSAFTLIDLRLYDAALRAAPHRPPSGRIAIVAIDDRSLAEVGQWPWTRDTLARLLDRLRRLGARAIALDVILAEPDRVQPSGTVPALQSNDAALASVLAQGRVVMSYAMTFTGADGNGCVLHPIQAVFVERGSVRASDDGFFKASGAVCSLPMLTGAAGASGFLNASPDRDGILRRVPLLMELNGQIYPSLSLAAVLESTGSRRVTVTTRGGGRLHVGVNGRDVPLDASGTLLVHFRGRRGTYPRLSASDVLAGRVAPGALNGRIVFVGATALGVQDVVATPFDTAMAGIEVHASAADTLMQGDFVSTPPYWRAFELLGTLALATAAAALVAALGFVYGSIASATLLAGLWWMAIRAVDAAGVFLSPVFPTLGVLLVLSALTVAKVHHERRRADDERSRRERAHRFAVESLTSLMETRDGATGRHARRTQSYSRVLAARLARMPRFREYLTPERMELISRLSPLHDIGKVGVPDAVLNKPGPLSKDEADEMRKHPGYGYDAIDRAVRLTGASGLADEVTIELAKDIVYTHHERWDGLGYPRGLKGEEIPIAGRIVAVVDVYDALSHSRTYRPSLSHGEAVATIMAGRGTHFDPDVVDVFLKAADEFLHLSRLIDDEGLA